MQEWEWATVPNTSHLFIHLLLMANHKDNKWRGKTIKRGELITSLSKLSEKTGLSIQSIRTSLNNLKSTQNITQYQHNQYTHISIKNYDDYQPTNTVPNTQLTHSQHTTNNKQEYKNEKNVRNIYTSLSSLDEDLYNEVASQYNVSPTAVKDLAEELVLYCKSRGKKYKDYRATLQNWVRKAKKEKKILPIISSYKDDEEYDEEAARKNLDKIREMKSAILN